MTPANVLVVEDERLAAEALCGLVKESPSVGTVRSVRDGRSAVSAIRESRPDIVFLDIELPEMDGFEVIEAVGVDKMPVVVFVTAYDRYSLRAFDVQGLDYLLKPFQPQRFRTSLARALRQVELRREGSGRRLPLKFPGRTVFVPSNEVHFIQASGNHIRIHSSNREYLVRDTMNGFETRLEGTGFVRIHRSVIVNRRHVREIRPWFTGEYVVILSSGKELTMSRGYRDRLPLLSELPQKNGAGK